MSDLYIYDYSKEQKLELWDRLMNLCNNGGELLKKLHSESGEHFDLKISTGIATEQQKAEVLDRALSAQGLRFHAEDEGKAALLDSMNVGEAEEPNIKELQTRLKMLERIVKHHSELLKDIVRNLKPEDFAKVMLKKS
jgi:hypothetical protein